MTNDYFVILLDSIFSFVRDWIANESYLRSKP